MPALEGITEVSWVECTMPPGLSTAALLLLMVILRTPDQPAFTRMKLQAVMFSLIADALSGTI